jgi:hypothetical protein
MTYGHVKYSTRSLPKAYTGRESDHLTRRSFPALAAALLAALAVALAFVLAGSPPPTNVDGLRVMTVTEVLFQRASGGLRNQPVAVGGYWSNGSVGHMCTVSFAQPGELELPCVDGEFGITELNEPIRLVGRFSYFTEANGPHLTPFFDQELPAGASYWHPDGTGWGSPPVPIVVVGHFDDPRAELCQAANRQRCLDRLVVDWVAYFNPSLARWAPNTPTPEPTDPPAPSHY